MRASASNQGTADQNDEIPSTNLHRAPYVLLLTLGYAAMALFAWVVTSILIQRPLGARSYVVDVDQLDQLTDAGHLFSTSQTYLRAARFLQAVTSILTIPLTTAVCSYAAVIFLQQHHPGRKGPTLRQSIALADRAWTDPVIISKLISGRWKHYGSPFLLMAILLNILGKCTRSAP